MPDRYVAEMACDRIAACRVYHGKSYTQKDALDYLINSKYAAREMHPDTYRRIEQLLKIAAESGETAMFDYIRKNMRKKKDSFTI